MPSNEATTLPDELDTIESLTGDGTELISIAHPPGKTIQSLRNRLQKEHASAQHIQSDRTRSRVQSALQRAHTITAQYETTPETGLVIYAGVVDGELLSFVFDDTTLPGPITDSVYKCSDTFATNAVQTTIGQSDAYGLLVIERGAAILGELQGNSTIIHHELESHVMGKTRAGGQSAQRFARDRERQLEQFFQEVATAAENTYMDNGHCRIKGLLIGGTLGTAKRFTRSSHLHPELERVILGVYSVEYATERGLEQLADRGQDAVRDEEHAVSREALDEFYTRLATDNPVEYGVRPVHEAARYGAVETLLVSQSVSADTRSKLVEVVTEYGGDVIEIPEGVARGVAFSETFDGVGALLRFPIN